MSTHCWPSRKMPLKHSNIQFLFVIENGILGRIPAYIVLKDVHYGRTTKTNNYKLSLISGSQQDPCSSVGNPCVFGICRVNFSFGADQPYCECPPDRTGRQCESIVGRRQCLHNTCFNGGICYVEVIIWNDNYSNSTSFIANVKFTLNMTV